MERVGGEYINESVTEVHVPPKHTFSIETNSLKAKTYVILVQTTVPLTVVRSR